MYVVYALLDPDTLLIRYIGLTKNPQQRQWEHRSYRKNPHHKQTYYNNWRLKLFNAGKSPIFAVINYYPTEDIALEAEAVWIRLAKEAGFKLTNYDPGGKKYNSNRKVTWGDKISAGKKGKRRKPQSKESIEKVASAHRGMKRSIESRKRMSEAQIKSGGRDRMIERNKTTKFAYPPERLAKMSEIMKQIRANRPWSTKPISKISESGR